MTTTTRGYPVPEGVESAGVPADMLALAEAVDSDVGGLATAVAGVGAFATVSPSTDYAHSSDRFSMIRFDAVGSPWTDGLTVGQLGSHWIQIPTSGRYNIRARVNWVAGGTGARQLYLMRNVPTGSATVSSTIQPGDRMDVDLDSTATYRTLRTEATIYLAAGETVHAIVYQISGGVLNFYQWGSAAYNSMQITRIS